MTPKGQPEPWNIQPTIGLKMNTKKAKLIKLLENEEDPDDDDGVVVFEEVSEF